MYRIKYDKNINEYETFDFIYAITYVKFHLVAKEFLLNKGKPLYITSKYAYTNEIMYALERRIFNNMNNT